MDKASQSTIIAKYELLDYSDFRNYERLCAEYRKALDAKDGALIDALYAQMRAVQKSRRHNLADFKMKKTQNKKTEVKIINGPTRKELLVSKLANQYTKTFSTANVFYYCYKKKDRVTPEEVAKELNAREFDVMAALDFGASIQVFTKYTDGKYKVRKIKKILEYKLERYVNTPENVIREKYEKEIEKNGAINVHPANINHRIKKKQRNIEMTSRDDLTGKYDRSGDIPFFASEYSSSNIDSMHETGHGRKKSSEYTKNMAIENSRSRYGLKNGKPILEYDLD